MLETKVCRHQRASMVWEGPSMAYTSKAKIQYTSLDRLLPAPSGETTTSASAGMSSVPAAPWRSPETDPLWFQSGELVDWVLTATSVDKSWSMRSAHPLQITCQPTVCPTPADRGLSHQLYKPFRILSQQEIGPNHFHTKEPDNPWGVSPGIKCDLPFSKVR